MIRRLVCVVSFGALFGLVGCGGDESSVASSGAGGSGSSGTTSVATGGGNGGASATTTSADTTTTTSTGSGMLCPDPLVCGSCNNVVSFAADVEPFLAQSCGTTSCHKGVSPKGALNTEVGKAYDELVDVDSVQCMGNKKLIAPGDPAGSYVMDKVLNQNLCSGKKMPPSASLAAEKIQLLADWICAGALND
jgi:hypothetical protein